MNITTVGLDLAKNVFQVHAIDDAGEFVVGKALRRRQMMPFFSKLDPCLVGMEACATSHYWARQLTALGHQVKLMPPIYVKPYVKRGKTDAGDAEAISEAVTRPTMRFVAVKSVDQQSMLALHRTRDLLIRQRTQLVNMIRGQLAEFGIVLAKGIQHVFKFTGQLLGGEAPDIPPLAVSVIVTLAEQLRDLHARIGGLDKDIRTWSKPLTSGSKAAGRYGKQDFRYLTETDEYLCPGGERLVRHSTGTEDGPCMAIGTRPPASDAP